MRTRTLRDGKQLPEHEHPVHLHVVTRCPAKYRLVDLETGEVWQVRDEPPYVWRREPAPTAPYDRLATWRRRNNLPAAGT